MALAGEARLGEAGHLPGGSGEVHVAPAAPAALAQNVGLLVAHVLDDLVGLGVPDQSTPGNADDHIRAVLAGFSGTLTVHAVGGHVLTFIAEVHQGGQIVVHLQDDGAALAAVAAVRAAGRHIFFTVERYHAIAAVAGPDRDTGFVNKRCCHETHLRFFSSMPGVCIPRHEKPCPRMRTPRKRAPNARFGALAQPDYSAT